jgi:hypothetical protein
MEPHAVQVWAFHAWNMAYNVSVMMADDQDRWRWVRNGLRLLRDRAIKINPASADLHAELAWIYHHKIASEYDPAHAAYKRQFGRDVAAILPKGRLGASATSSQVSGLADAYGLDAEELREVDGRYGPLDWRLADAHAIYWASAGRQLAAGDQRALLRCERAIYQAMARTFFSGQFGGVDAPDADLALPRPDLLLRVISTFEAALSDHPDDEGILNAYLSFLSGAIMFFDAQGDAQQARRLYAAMAERVPDKTAPLMDFATFVASRAGLRDLPFYVREAIHRARQERP